MGGAHTGVEDIDVDPGPDVAEVVRAVERQQRLVDAIEAESDTGLGGVDVRDAVLLDPRDVRIAGQRGRVLLLQLGDKSVQHAGELGLERSGVVAGQRLASLGGLQLGAVVALGQDNNVLAGNGNGGSLEAGDLRGLLRESALIIVLGAPVSSAVIPHAARPSASRAEVVVRSSIFLGGRIVLLTRAWRVVSPPRTATGGPPSDSGKSARTRGCGERRDPEVHSIEFSDA
jgi:hypothetical protein